MTLLYPMYARALETQRPDALARDPEAVEMQKKIAFDFSLFDRIENRKTFCRKDLQAGIAIRTRISDDHMQRFLQHHPEALIINMGCGLDARFFRLDNGKMQWIDAGTSW